MDTKRSLRFRETLRTAALAVPCLALIACASAPKEERAAPVAAPTQQKVDQGPPPISTRAMLHFEDANKAVAEELKSAHPNWERLQRLYEAALSEDDRLAEADYDLGVVAQHEGNLDAAVAHYQSALKKKPSLKEAAEGLALVAELKGDVQGAIGTWNELRRQYDDDPVCREHLADLYRREGDPDRALQLAEEALVRDPVSKSATKTMFEAYLDKKVWSLARLVQLRAVKLSPDDPELYYGLGEIDLAERHPDRAKAQFEKTLELDPHNAQALAQLARMALEAENYALAEKQLRHLLQVDGNDAHAHLDLGVTLAQQGQYDAAMQEYDLAQKADPKLAEVYLDRGIILTRHKDAPDRGLELFKQYLALAGRVPRNAPVRSLMKEAKALVDAKAQAAAAEAQAKQMEAQAKANQAAMEKAQAQQKGQKPQGAPSGGAPAGGQGALKPAAANPTHAQGSGAGEPKDTM